MDMDYFYGIDEKENMTYFSKRMDYIKIYSLFSIYKQN